ncbi:MAG: NfeD family protein [Microcoleus vaginatus WJT46-NPBG5]|nr:NfeD family protein [Microcoleus vaginatus WJT46-NPBG5]
MFIFAVRIFSEAKADNRPNTGVRKHPLKLTFRYLVWEAIVDEPIQPKQVDRVQFDGSLCPARCEQEVTLAAGQSVCVVGRCGLTLLVEPAGSKVREIQESPV